MIVSDRVRGWKRTLPRRRETHPLSGEGSRRRRRRRGDESDLSDLSLRTSERGKIIFTVDWSSVTPFFDREIIPGREEKRYVSESTVYGDENGRECCDFN